jgi:hypothetical protein
VAKSSAAPIAKLTQPSMRDARMAGVMLRL